MTKHKQERERAYRPLSNVDQGDDMVIPEEFPEGPVGSPIRNHQKTEGKSTPWKPGQQSISAYTYYDKDQHDDLPRQLDGSHPLHDE